jgi:hypothetical protein
MGMVLIRQPAVRTPLVSVLISLAFVAHLAAADVSGTWALEFQRNSSTAVYQADCSFKQEGERVSGSCLSGFEGIVPVRGNAKDKAITFQFPTGVESGTTATFTGQLDAEEAVIKGTWTFVDDRGNKGEGTFTATRK